MADRKSIVTITSVMTFVLMGSLAAGSAPVQATEVSDPSPGGQPEQRAVGGDELQEVIVTAERRTSSLLTTPISVAAISGDTLAEKQQVNVSDLQRTTPDFQVNTTGLYDSINIRGIGNTAITPAIQPGVAVFHDGLLGPETVGIDTPFFDIADVEILRGPQGTLVSAASTGGSVQITSRNPDLTGGIGGYAEALVGNYSEHKLQGAINLPVNDTLALRVAFNVDKRGSFYRDAGSVVNQAGSAPGYDPGRVDQENMRIGLLWQPTDAFSALLKVEVNYSNPGGQAGQPNPATFRPFPGQSCPNPLDGNGPTCYSPYYHYGTGVPYLLNYNPDIPLYDVQRQYRIGLDLHYTLANGIVLRSLSGFQRLSSNESENSCACSSNQLWRFYDDTGPNDDYYSEDLSIASPTGGRFTWIVGADMFYRYTPVFVTQEQYTYFPLDLYPPNQPFQITQLGAGYNSGSTARTQGLFANVDWNFTDKLQLNAGIRGNWDESYGRGNVQLTIPCSPTVGGGCPFPGITPGTWATFPVTIPNASNFKDRSPTGKIGLNYTPIPGQFLYAFFARGYKPGGAQAGLPNFNPEHVNDWELGWKSHLLRDHVQLQLGAFYMKYQDMQFSGFNATNPAAAAVTNIGASKIDGLEFSSQARVGRFDTRIDVAYLHSVLGNITQIASYRLPPNAVVPQCAPGQTAGCFDYAPYQTSLNGESNPYSPKLTASIDVDYRIPIGQDVLRPRLSYSYTGSQYVSRVT